jgi:hypothetical protein
MPSDSVIQATKVAHRTVNIRDLDVFYRESRPQDAAIVLLSHGFPARKLVMGEIVSGMLVLLFVLPVITSDWRHGRHRPGATANESPSQLEGQASMHRSVCAVGWTRPSHSLAHFVWPYET